MAAWRDRRLGERGDLTHRAVIDPSVRRMVGPVRGLRVLDLGCGNGYLARQFARASAAEVVGVDLSAPTLALARARERRRPLGVRYLRRDAADLRGLAAGAFDVVVANMCLMDIADVRGALAEAGRVLRPEGRLVLSLSHPCFDRDDRSAWDVEHVQYEETVWRRVRGYRVEEVREIPWMVAPGRFVTTRSYLRTLTTYFADLARAGFVVRRLDEPMPRAEFLRKSSSGRYVAEIPLHLVIEAVRFDRAGLGSGRFRRGVTAPASRRRARSRARGARRSESRGRTTGTGSSRRAASVGS